MNEQQNKPLLIPKTTVARTVEVSIRFGNPKYADCRNFGICKMEIAKRKITRKGLEDGYCRGTITAHQEKFQLSIRKDSMTKATVEKYFGKHFFGVTISIEIPLWIAEKFGNTPLEIRNGAYSYIENKDFFILNDLIKPLKVRVSKNGSTVLKK